MAVPHRTSVLTLMRVEQKHANDIERILQRSADDLSREILASPEGSLTRMQLEAQKASINAHLSQDFSNIGKVVQQGQIDAARASSRVISMYENELLSTVMSQDAMNSLAASEANRAVGGVEAALRRMEGSSHVPLSRQVYRTRQLASGWVDDIINQGLASGWDARRLAREIRSSISPRVRGGVSYAANRLARTEINNAFHASAIKRYEESGIVDSVDWNLSSSHPEGDICDDLKHNSPYKIKSVPRKPHPNCYCFITPHLPTEEEFLENLLAGKYGDTPWVGMAHS